MIDLVRLPGYDANGNPRYVCYYSDLLSEADRESLPITSRECGNIAGVIENMDKRYALAVAKSHKIGGRKYNTKKHPRCIVFTDYENVIRRAIRQLVEKG